MKNTLKVLIAGSLLSGSFLFADQARFDGPGPASTDPTAPFDNTAFANVDLSTLDSSIQDLVTTYRTEQQALQTELQAEIAALTDPTRDQIDALKQAFADANAERIAAQKALFEQIREAIDAARDAVQPPEDTHIGDRMGDLQNLDPAVQDMITTFRTEQQALRDELKAAIAALTDPTQADIDAVKQAFLDANAERIAAQQALAQEIRDAIAAARETTTPPDVSQETKDLIDQFHAARDELRQAHQQLRSEWNNLSDTDKEALAESLRDAQQTKLQELKDIQRQLRDSRGADTGANRN